MDAAAEKTCSTCGDTKTLDEFYVAKQNKGGYDGWCKECRKAYNRRRAAKFALEGFVEPPEKECGSCGKTKPIEVFAKASYSKDGRQNKCRPCQQAYDRQYKIDNRDRVLDAVKAWHGKHRVRLLANEKELRDCLIHLKSATGCMNCGERRWQCLDWHHRDPQRKSFDICKHRVRSVKKLRDALAEIEKCDVLCRNCHAMVTNSQRGYQVTTTQERADEILAALP